MDVREAAAVAAMGWYMNNCSIDTAAEVEWIKGVPIFPDVARLSAVRESTKWADSLVAALNEGKPKKKRGTFVADKPPSVDEVAAYCRERGNNVDPRRFVDYYISNGWKIGKAKTPMKDWKAAIRGPWEDDKVPADALRGWANGAG